MKISTHNGSHSLSGEYAFDEVDEESDEADNMITITHGYSKAHRPDLKQVIQEMIVTQDGGVPLACKNWDGNKADTAVFKARSKAIVENLKSSEMPGYLVADSKLYHSDNAEFLSLLKFIARVPSTIKLEKQSISEALQSNNWQVIDDNYRYVVNSVKHLGIQQRWVIIHSQAAQSRAEKTISKQVQRAEIELEKALFHLQAQRFACEEDAKRSLNKIAKKAKYHQIKTPELKAYTVYEGKGRPLKNAIIKQIDWQISAHFEEKPDVILSAIEQKSCFVLTTNIEESELPAESILRDYKKSVVEQGLRFLKDPLFFVSSLFIKKPSRIDSLLMIMTLSLLVYSIAQTRLRARMAKSSITIPNQIKKEIATPTLRWVFQCFEGINLIEYETTNLILIEGLSE